MTVSSKLVSLPLITARGSPLYEQQVDLAEDKIRAECKGGLILREIERQERKRTDLTAGQTVRQLTPYQEALQKTGLEERMARRWQVMSYVPEEDLESYFAKRRSYLEFAIAPHAGVHQ